MTNIPRIDGVLEVALYVNDLQASTAFYQRVFGFDIIASDERLQALGVGGRQVLLVCTRKASANLPLGAHDAYGRQHVAFAVPASDLESWETRLQQHAVTVEERRHWARGGVSLYFRDPDGHLIELATPGVWSIY